MGIVHPLILSWLELPPKFLKKFLLNLYFHAHCTCLLGLFWRFQSSFCLSVSKFAVTERETPRIISFRHKEGERDSNRHVDKSCCNKGDFPDGSASGLLLCSLCWSLVSPCTSFMMSSSALAHMSSRGAGGDSWEGRGVQPPRWGWDTWHMTC